MPPIPQRTPPLMPRLIHTLAGALVAAAVLALPLQADWRPVGPYGATVTFLAVNPARPSTIIAGTLGDHGIYRSGDRGVTWTPVLSEFPQRTTGQVVFDPLHPGRVYASFDLDVWSSADDGRTWSSNRMDFHTAGGSTTIALAIDPRGRSVVYASAGGLYKSNNRGQTWVFIGSALTAQSASALAFDPTSASLYSVTVDGIYRSRDGGVTWRQLGLGGVDLEVLALAPSDPRVIYAGGPNGLFRSADRGAHWQAIDAELPGRSVTAVAVHPSLPGTLYVALQTSAAGVPGGLFQSVDGGSHWTALTGGLPAGDVLTVAIDPARPSLVFAGLPQVGVFRSGDAGSHWTWSNTGLRSADVMNVAPDPARPGTVYAGPTLFGLYKTTDAGLSWQLVNDRVTDFFAPFPALVALDPRQTATVYASMPGRFERSDDGGQSWRPLANGAVSPEIFTGLFAVDPREPGTLFTAGDAVITKSGDRGETWGAPVEILKDCLLVPLALAVSPAAPAAIYVATKVEHPCNFSGGIPGLFKSIDGGAEWTQVVDLVIRQVLPDPRDAAVVYALNESSHLIKSTDGGVTFASTGEAASHLLIATLAIDPAATRLYAGLAENTRKVLSSADGGVTWEQVGSDLDGRLFAIAVDPNVPGRLWAGTDHSVFVFDP